MVGCFQYNSLNHWVSVVHKYKISKCVYMLVLSGINNLKSVRFFKLVLRYDYSIVLYVSGMHNAV